MKNKTLVISGIVIIVAGAVVMLLASSLYSTASRVYWFESMQRGNSLHTLASIVQVAGLVAGAVGLVMLLAGLTRRQPATQSPQSLSEKEQP